MHITQVSGGERLHSPPITRTTNSSSSSSSRSDFNHQRTDTRLLQFNANLVYFTKKFDLCVPVSITHSFTAVHSSHQTKASNYTHHATVCTLCTFQDLEENPKKLHLKADHLLDLYHEYIRHLTHTTIEFLLL